MYTPVNSVDGEPRVRDALIGAAFGILLIYLGTRISLRVVSWPILGCGFLFVIVMAAFIFVTFWNHVSPHVRRLLARARGHVREDAQLGTLTRDVKGQYWQATLPLPDRTVDLIIEGTDEPVAALFAAARELVANFDALQERLRDYLAREAQEEALEDPELAAEIRELRLQAILLRSIDRPNHAVIDFESPDEIRYWYCDYVDGELSGLQFDS
jgi:hypothetical protein